MFSGAPEDFADLVTELNRTWICWGVQAGANSSLGRITHSESLHADVPQISHVIKALRPNS